VSDPGDAVERTRRGVGVFEVERGLISVGGRDRVRWLNGMISADVTTLEPGPTNSGCYALLLTPKGSIVADLHVLYGEAELRLELESAATPDVIARLDRYVVADDVVLQDVSRDQLRLAVEGPQAIRLLAAAGCPAAASLQPDAWLPARLGGVAVDVAAWGTSGESAFQLFVGPDDAHALRVALREAATGLDLVEAGPEALELLRIEAGVPRLGAELDEDVLPAEAGLTDRAVSFTKGCYTGQEIVARIESRGQVNHLLVGLSFDAGASLPRAGSKLRDGDREIGEVTSAGLSPHAGAIGLGYVRRPLHAAGTELAVDGGRARVTALPFVAPSKAEG
jgi:folate-binding protein YgfZ